MTEAATAMFMPLSAEESGGMMPLADQAPEWRPIVPVPAEVKGGIPAHRLGKPSRWWVYRNAEGQRLFVVCRFDLAGGGKEILPLTYGERADGKREWAWKGLPALRPLYRLDALAARPGAPVLIVEGEKAADAAAVMFPDYVVTTSPNGANAAAKTDWSPLAGRRVVAWPDHDEEGNSYAAKVVQLASDAGAASVAIVAIPSDFPAKWDLADEPPEGADLAAMLEAAKAGEANGPDDATTASPPPVISLDAPDLPRLKVGCLPAWAGDFAAALAAATETPEELAVGMVLAAVATAAARRFRVLVKPGYFEPTNLWCAVALPPGNRKSAVQGAAAAPLLTWEREQAEAIREEIKRVSSDAASLTARANHLRQKAAKEEDGIERERLQREAADIEADMPEVPRAPQLWTSDATPERMGVLLAEHGERMAWLSSEGGIFDLLSGRYSGGIPNLDLVLKAHSGDPDRVDRGSRPPVFLQHPLLTIGLSPQPDVLRGLASKPGFRGRGLLGRFLFLLPPSPLGYRTLDAAAVPETVSNAYAAGLQALLNMPPALGDDGEERPHLLRLAPDALAEWQKFAHAMETTMRPGGGFEGATDWAGKAPGAAARVAAVLHCIKHTHASPAAEPINIQTMNAALEIMAVVAGHSLAAFDLMGADESIAAARRVWDWIKRNRLPEFSERDAFNALRGTFPRMADLREAMEALAERGYVEMRERPAEGRGRPPSPLVIVHPELARGWQ